VDEAGTRRFLAFDVGGSTYAVEVERVEVVLEMVPITRVPRAPEHLRGVINHRGTVIPVADLRVRFGEGLSDLEAGGSIAVLEIRKGPDTLVIGVLAETVREVVDFEVARIVPPPSFGNARLAGMVTGVYEKEGTFIVLLDIDKIFEDAA
jgi:purine-binding chemotaxis protein CheW